MQEKAVLAYDLGTSGVKGVLVSTSGDVIASCTTPYPLYTPQSGWAEQNPEDYWKGVCKVTHEVMEKADMQPSTVVGIAFGTMWKGIIPIDANGTVLHNSVIWLDARAERQANALNQRLGETIFSSSDYWPKLMWLRENRPDVIENAKMILDTSAFLKWKATGTATVDISNSFTRSFDPELDQFYEQVISICGIPREKFPPVVHSTDLVGRLLPNAAKELGLCEGTPVFGGNNDIQAVTVGSGCSRVGGVHVYFGSSGWVGYTIPHVSNHTFSPFDTKRDIHLLGMQAIGLSFNWVVKKLYAAEQEQYGDKIFSIVDQGVDEIAPGSDGVFATPWFYGDWPPLFGPDARGNFLNLGPEHDRRHMARAMMEGVCYHLKMQSRRVDYPMPSKLSAIGGGSRSDVWMQMLADIMEIPVCVPEDTSHAGAIGTAYSALIGLGLCSDFSDADRMVKTERTYYPRPEAVAVYRENYTMFEQLYAMLKPMFSRMNGPK